MKKVLSALIAIMVVVLSGCNSYVPKEEADKVAHEKDSIMVEALRQGNEIAMLQGSLNDVEKQLDALNGQIAVSNGEDQDLVSQRNRLIQKLEILQQNMKEKQQQLDDLQKNYGNVLNQNKELKKTIERLKDESAKYVATISTYEKKMAEQGAKIDSLSTNLAVTQETLATAVATSEQQQQVITAQDQMLNKAYYIVAGKSTLKELGLIEGGLFNKKRLSTKGFDVTGFTSVDIRELSEIALGSKDAKILSSHPESSYELVKGYDKSLTLVIKDATEFWSNTKFLVVMI